MENEHIISDEEFQSLVEEMTWSATHILATVRAALAALNEGTFREDDHSAILNGCEWQTKAAIECLDKIIATF